jgi:NodT family efflux transporter outer membrane factor (OMF) lipoprotein
MEYWISQRWLCAAGLVGAGLLTGCTNLAPPATTPAVATTAQWAGAAAAGWIKTDARPHWQTTRWWELFNDPVLNGLAAQVDVNNQNLALAAANVAQAEALLRAAEAGLFPTLGAQAGDQRGGRPTHSSVSLGLDASWAPDVWGSIADSIRAQGANVQASVADLAAARLSAQGGMTQAYFGLREADAEGALLDDIIAGYERAEQITRNSYQAGIAPHTDLLQAQGTLESARATRAALAASRTTFEHAIALFVGKAPADFKLAAAPWKFDIPAIPDVLPSELLLRRPDIAAAERSVVAANARIGVARAAYFPSFGLSASLGGSAATLSTLASAPVLAWSLGLSAAQTLFDGGARGAAVDQARALHDAATATYRQTALTAFGQVEDQLTALGTLATQIDHTRAAAAAATGAETRILNSYRAGISAYTDVITAQATALSTRRSVLQLELQRQQAAVSLIQALGGGWQAPWAASPGTAENKTAS